MRRSLLAFVVTAAVFLMAVPPVRAATTVVVSGPSPFAGCVTPDDGPHEKTYVNAEVEPWVAADPATPEHLVGVWQQDRHAFGGANGLAAATSFDGGQTWTESALPLDVCAPGGLPYDRASDPWVSIGPDGTVYSVSISWSETSWDNVTAVATSSDGGLTWNAPIVVHANLGPVGKQWFDDKESVTADPTRPGVAYIVWDRGGGADRDGGDRRPRAAAHYSQPVWLTMTTDGGATWSEARPIFKPGNHRSTIGNQIMVDPATGRLYDVFDYKRSSGHWFESFITSDDGGATWSTRRTISRDRAICVRDPRTQTPLRTSCGMPDVAIDPATGAVYVVWEDARFTHGAYDEVALSYSNDGGATWSDPVRASRQTGLPAFTPSVEVGELGAVGVSYYDLRDERTVPTGITTSCWLDVLEPGGGERLSETRLAGPFDQGTAPFSGGRFLGDYEGLAVIRDPSPGPDRFVAFFAVANDGNVANRTDIVSVVV